MMALGGMKLHGLALHGPAILWAALAWLGTNVLVGIAEEYLSTSFQGPDWVTGGVLGTEASAALTSNVLSRNVPSMAVARARRTAHFEILTSVSPLDIIGRGLWPSGPDDICSGKHEYQG